MATISFYIKDQIHEIDTDKAYLITVDNNLQELIPKGKSFTYKEVQEAIKPDCLIQPICLRYWTTHRDHKKLNFICDEEGMINGSKLNAAASELLQAILGPNAQDLYGNIVITPNKLFRL